MTDPKIDYKKIIISVCEMDGGAWTSDDIYNTMRQAAIEAIRLAAPLLALEATTEYTHDGYVAVSMQSILDAVDEVTKIII